MFSLARADRSPPSVRLRDGAPARADVAATPATHRSEAALASARFLAAATGAQAVALHDQHPFLAGGDVIVVAAPRRFGCLWRKTRCARVLEDASKPVLVAARAPRAFERCLFVARSLSRTDAATPLWLARIKTRALAIALDAPSFVFPHAPCVDVPSMYSGVACGLEEATRASHALEARFCARFHVTDVVRSPGTVVDTVRAARAQLGAFDLVCVDDAAAAGFGILLRACIDTLQTAVLVLPGTRAPPPFSLAIAPLP